MDCDPGGVEQTRRHVLFDPFGVGIDFARCPVGCTHGYSHSGPFGAGTSKRHTLIQRRWVQRDGGSPIELLHLLRSCTVEASSTGGVFAPAS